MNFIQFKKDIEFALVKKYSIQIYYSDDIDFENNTINWKYPSYQIKNILIDKIIEELEIYFKNFKDFIIVMHLIGSELTHKIPIHLPSKKIE